MQSAVVYARLKSKKNNNLRKQRSKTFSPPRVYQVNHFSSDNSEEHQDPGPYNYSEGTEPTNQTQRSQAKKTSCCAVM